MTKAKLYVVGSGSPSPFDNMEKLRKENEVAFAALVQKQQSRPDRLPRHTEQFVRVPWYLLQILARNNGFPAWVRLYLCLWYRTHESKRSVRVTAALAAEAGIDRRNKLRELRQLETRGLVRIYRDGTRVPEIIIIPYPREQL